MSRTTKRYAANVAFALAIGILGALAALPAFAQDVPPMDPGGGDLPVPASLTMASLGVGILVRAIRAGSEMVANSKRWTALVAFGLGAVLGALGLTGHVGAPNMVGQVYAGLLAGALVFTAAALAGPKARLES